MVSSFAVLLLLIIISNSHVFAEANAVSSQPITINASGSVQTTASAFLYTSGINIYDSNNEKVIWNGITTNTLFGYEMYASNGVLTEGLSPTDIDTIRSHGLNLVRLDIALNSAVYGQDYHNQTPTKLNYYPRFWTLLGSLVSEVQNDGMWVDINFAPVSWSPLGGVWGNANGFPTWMYNGSWSYFNKTYSNDLTGEGEACRDFFNLTDPTAANVRLTYQTFWEDIAYHFKNTQNVVFSLFNEPLNIAGYQMFPDGQSDITSLANNYQTFMEQTIDDIRTKDNGNHIILINEAYFWNYTSNLQIQRPNIVVEAHSYSGVSTDFFNLGWRYNQPFYVGEYGGVEQGLQNESATISVMQTCNSYNVSRSYLCYNPPSAPSTQTWTDLQNNLNPYVIYYHQAR
jgi:hypothetical protein